MAYTQQPKNVGSIYLNLPENASAQDRQDKINILSALNDMKAYFSISLKNEQGGYDKFTGFVNTYKKDDKSPDINIRASRVSQTPARQTPVAKSRFQARPRVEEEATQVDEGFPL